VKYIKVKTLCLDKPPMVDLFFTCHVMKFFLAIVVIRKIEDNLEHETNSKHWYDQIQSSVLEKFEISYENTVKCPVRIGLLIV